MTVIGMGYVGLVTATVFASQGHKVWGVDVDGLRIEKLTNGIAPFYEPGLPELLNESLKNEAIEFTCDLSRGLNSSRVVFICVGTPSLIDGTADLSYVKHATESVARLANNSMIIVNKSTVPVGTADLIDKLMATQLSHRSTHYAVASIPEFLREGRAIKDAMRPDRVVIGCNEDWALSVLGDLHRDMHSPVLHTDRRTAEMIKYASNAFLATKISFINEIACLCEKLGADVTEVARGMGYDSRIGNHFLNAGIGYGGSCFPKDTKALVQIAGEVHHDFKLLKSVIEVNQQQRLKPLKLLRTYMKSIKGAKVAVLGLSFKPGTDDVREAPSLDILAALRNASVDVVASDPHAIDNTRRALETISSEVQNTAMTMHTGGQYGNVTFVKDHMKAISGADAVIILTEWPEYATIDWNEAASLMRGRLVIDGRNMFEPQVFRHLSMTYLSIGRQPVNPGLYDGLSVMGEHVL